MTQKSNGMGNKMMIGAGIAALAAAAGAVFLYGTDAGKKKRTQIKGWMLKLKGEVLEQLETMQDWSEAAYHTAVDTVAEKYKQVKNVDPVEWAAIVGTLKNQWKLIQRQVQGGSKKKSSAKKASSKKTKK
jgi:hypothetical protein